MIADDRVLGAALASPPDIPRASLDDGCTCDWVPGWQTERLLSLVDRPTLWMSDQVRSRPAGLGPLADFEVLEGPHSYTAPMVAAALSWLKGTLGWPAGVRLVLVDAANLPAFALGQTLGGPAAGYNSVLYFGLVLQGVAGALLARTVGGAPWLGAIAAMACPTLLSNAADGMTEGFAVGWVGVQLAALLRALRGDGKVWAAR